MRNVSRAILVVVAALLPRTVQAQPSVTARGAIIVDADSGAVIWEQNADEELPPASTTKVMTAILALQSHRLDEHFVVSDYAASTPPSKIGLRPGQTVALRDLLYAVLLKSANDAAVVVAEGVAGTEASFAERMNLKARVIGASYTNFMNPHGLTEYGHETTARDLSRIFRYGLGVPGFREVLSTPSAEVPIDGPSARLALVRSHNRLLNAPDFQVIGKTGYTRPARRCFVGAAGHDSREVVIVILGSNDLWGDARRMLDYGLSAGRPAPVLQMASAPLPAAALAAEEPPPAFARAAAPEPTATATASALEKRAESPPRAVPPPEPVPVEIARADIERAPEAALARAARMARAQTAEPSEPEPARLDEDEVGERARLDDSEARARVLDERPSRAAAAAPATIGPRDGALPSAADEPAHQRMVMEPVRARVVDEPPDEPTAVAQNGQAPEGEEADPEPTRSGQPPDPEQPQGGIWADSPLRKPGEAATVRPARAEEQKPARPEEADKEPAVADQPAQRRGAPSRQLAAEARTKGRASRNDAQRESVASARSTAKTSRHSATASREERAERRHGVVLARAVGSDARSSRSIRRAIDVERDQPTNKRGRSARRSPEVDVENSTRASRRAGAKSPDKEQGKYTVQLGPYRDKKSVDGARTELARRGYEARVVGQKLELGNFADRSRADKLATRLRVSGHRAKSAEVR